MECDCIKRYYVGNVELFYRATTQRILKHLCVHLLNCRYLILIKMYPFSRNPITSYTKVFIHEN